VRSPAEKSDDRAQGWRASFVSAADEFPLQDDDFLAWCPECAEREFGTGGWPLRRRRDEWGAVAGREVLRRW
jgi:hypothetical protein